MKSDEIRVGEESKCTLCRFGKIIRSRAMADPVRVAMAQREDPEFKAPPNIALFESYCTHPLIVGQTVIAFPGWFGRQRVVNGHGPAKSIGIIIDCEMFEARSL